MSRQLGRLLKPLSVMSCYPKPSALVPQNALTQIQPQQIGIPSAVYKLLSHIFTPTTKPNNNTKTQITS